MSERMTGLTIIAVPSGYIIAGFLAAAHYSRHASAGDCVGAFDPDFCAQFNSFFVGLFWPIYVLWTAATTVIP